jgi:hypothetical protein
MHGVMVCGQDPTIQSEDLKYLFRDGMVVSPFH